MGLHESMSGRDLTGPLLDGLRFDFHGESAGATDEVMVVASGCARAIERLTVLLQ